MISIASLIYKSRQRLNKLATNDHQEIPIEDLILVINEAQLKLVKKKGQSSPSGVGMDGSTKRYQDLEFLVEPAELHKLTVKEVNKKLHRFTASLDLTPQFLFYVDSYLLCEKGSCKDRIVWVNGDLVPHSSITTLLQNSNYTPSFEYQETFCDLSGDDIGIYTDGTFTPTALYLSYIRYPKKVDYEGYEHFNGEDSTTVDSEFPEYMEDELLDIIETDLKLYTENPAYAASLQKGTE